MDQELDAKPGYNFMNIQGVEIIEWGMAFYFDFKKCMA